MAIDFKTETIKTFPEAAKMFPETPHVCTLVRWSQRGIRGIRLDYARAGRKLITSVEAIQRFCNALAAADEKPDAHPPAPSTHRRGRSRRQSQVEAAEKFCDSRGI